MIAAVKYQLFPVALNRFAVVSMKITSIWRQIDVRFSPHSSTKSLPEACTASVPGSIGRVCCRVSCSCEVCVNECICVQSYTKERADLQLPARYRLTKIIPLLICLELKYVRWTPDNEFAPLWRAKYLSLFNRVTLHHRVYAPT